MPAISLTGGKTKQKKSPTKLAKPVKTIEESAYQIPTNEKENMIKNNFNPTYGELTKIGLKSLMKKVDIKEGKTFVDLGSGSGNVVINAITLYPKLKKVIGVEYSKYRHNIASRAKKNKVPVELQKKVMFYHDDLFNKSFKNYDIIYVSNLCFSDSLNEKLGKKLSKELKKGSYVFTSRDVYINRDTESEIFTVKQSWSNDSQLLKYKILN